MAFRFGREREREGGEAGEMRFMHALWLPNCYGFFFPTRVDKVTRRWIELSRVKFERLRCE